MRPLLSLALCFCAQNALAQNKQAEPNYFRIAWSPDSRTLAFESNRDGKTRVYTIDIAGTNLKTLTADTTENFQPTWTPDGKHIVFGSTRAGHGQLYVMNPDGSNVQRLTNAPGSDFNPIVSPDGRWIVFQSQTQTRSDQYTIHIMRADGSGRRLLSDTLMVTESPEFSVDGTRISYTQTPISKQEWQGLPPRDMIRERKKLEHHISMRLDGSDARPSPPDTTVCCARRTADGKAVYFTSTRDGARALYVRNADGGGVLRIAAASEVPEPEVSPDGRWFAFVRNNGIYVREIVTGAERLLVSGQQPRS